MQKKAEKILLHIQIHKTIYLILFFGILPFVFYNNLNTPHTDIEFYSNKIFFTTWSNISFGSFRFFLFPVDYLIYLSSKIFSSELTVKFFYALFLSGSGIATFYVIKKFIKVEIIAFIGALFYMYGIYGQFASFWYPINLLGLILPVITLRVLKINKRTSTVLESIAIAFLFFLLTGTNLTFIAYLLIWVTFLILHQIVEVGYRNGLKSLLIVFLGGISSLLLSGYYYLTLFAEFHYQSNIINTSLAIESPQWKSSASWLGELVREMGSVNYYYYFRGFSYPNAQPFIHNVFLLFVSFLFPFLAFLPIVLYKKILLKNKILLFLYPVLILLFLMAMGVFYLSPTKEIYQWVYDKLPYFSIFRDAYKPMYLIHFIYTILIAFTLNYFYVVKKKWFKWISVCTFLAIIAISYQFWSGTFLKYEEIAIPQYWQQFANYISDKREDSVTLTLPNMAFTGYGFTVNKGKNTSFYRPIFDNNVIYEEGGSVYDDSLSKQLYSSSVSNPSCFPKLSGFLGITYLLNQYDLYTRLYDNNPTAQQVNNVLSKSNGVNFVKHFGKLDLYSLDPSLVYDDVYIPKKIIQSNQGNYCNIAKESDGKNSVAFVNSNKTNQIQNSKPLLIFNNENNSVYTLRIKNMSANQLVVLNKRYDGGWHLYDLSQNQSTKFPYIISFLFQKPTSAKHIVVNGFSNGWYVEDNGQKERNFVLVYIPQLYFYIGLIISATNALLVFLVFLLYLVIKKYEFI